MSPLFIKFKETDGLKKEMYVALSDIIVAERMGKPEENAWRVELGHGGELYVTCDRLGEALDALSITRQNQIKVEVKGDVPPKPFFR